MDFIETLFGVAPDGGSGSLEMLWVGAILVALLVVGFRRPIFARLTARIAKRR